MKRIKFVKILSDLSAQECLQRGDLAFFLASVVKESYKKFDTIAGNKFELLWIPDTVFAKATTRQVNPE